LARSSALKKVAVIAPLWCQRWYA